MISRRAGLRDVSCRLRAALTLTYMCMTDSRRKMAQISRWYPAGKGLLTHGPLLQTGESSAHGAVRTLVTALTSCIRHHFKCYSRHT